MALSTPLNLNTNTSGNSDSTVIDQTTYSFQPVAYIHSPFKEKFAVPRQPGLVTASHQTVILTRQCNRQEILRGLEGFSHLWLIFVFHQIDRQGWKPTVRPPRLGGNERLGVFATRSPFRPNPIGLSAVKIENIHQKEGQWQIDVSGADMVDGTPILDIKPYVPYVDVITQAEGGFTETREFVTSEIVFSETAMTQIKQLIPDYPELEKLITQVLRQQPQPAFHKPRKEEKIYGMSLYDLNIRWTVDGNHITVYSIENKGNYS